MKKSLGDGYGKKYVTIKKIFFFNINFIHLKNLYWFLNKINDILNEDKEFFNINKQIFQKLCV